MPLPPPRLHPHPPPIQSPKTIINQHHHHLAIIRSSPRANNPQPRVSSVRSVCSSAYAVASNVTRSSPSTSPALSPNPPQNPPHSPSSPAPPPPPPAPLSRKSPPRCASPRTTRESPPCTCASAFCLAATANSKKSAAQCRTFPNPARNSTRTAKPAARRSVTPPSGATSLRSLPKRSSRCAGSARAGVFFAACWRRSAWSRKWSGLEFINRRAINLRAKQWRMRSARC
mmetsp:Transcript_5781/g.12187  ORF Transcript_5781/g.12187 Transcript_5781/m.12187 type:complete len:229 (+) Transcript_5781:206-892(+)